MLGRGQTTTQRRPDGLHELERGGFGRFCAHQRHKIDAIQEHARFFSRQPSYCFQGQPRFAHPADAKQVDQPAIRFCQQSGEQVDFFGATNERIRGWWQFERRRHDEVAQAFIQRRGLPGNSNAQFILKQFRHILVMLQCQRSLARAG